MTTGECGKRKLKYAEKNTLKALSVSDMRQMLKSKGVSYATKLKRAELCEEVLKEANKPTLLEYDGRNSCFIDSTLMSLFHSDHPYIRRIIFKKRLPFEKHPELHTLTKQIQLELQKIYNKNTTTCSILRRLFAQFDKEYARTMRSKGEAIEWLATQMEPFDVVNMIIKIFNVKDDVDIIVNKDKRKTNFNGVVIPAFDLARSEDKTIELKKYIPVHKDVTTIKYISAECLIVNIQRNFMDSKVFTNFSFPRSIKIKDDTRLNVHSIIVHHGQSTQSGHYTAFLKDPKHDMWYHYDDIGTQYQRVGTFKNMMEWKNGYVLRNCTTLVYLA